MFVPNTNKMGIFERMNTDSLIIRKLKSVLLINDVIENFASKVFYQSSIENHLIKSYLI